MLRCDSQVTDVPWFCGTTISFHNYLIAVKQIWKYLLMEVPMRKKLEMWKCNGSETSFFASSPRWIDNHYKHFHFVGKDFPEFLGFADFFKVQLACYNFINSVSSKTNTAGINAEAKLIGANKVHSFLKFCSFSTNEFSARKCISVVKTFRNPLRHRDLCFFSSFGKSCISKTYRADMNLVGAITWKQELLLSFDLFWKVLCHWRVFFLWKSSKLLNTPTANLVMLSYLIPWFCAAVTPTRAKSSRQEEYDKESFLIENKSRLASATVEPSATVVNPSAEATTTYDEDESAFATTTLTADDIPGTRQLMTFLTFL